MSVSISIINQKGGVGKTTSSLNISAVLAANGAKVLLMDLDPQGNSSDTLLKGAELDNDYTMYHLLMSEAESTRAKKLRDELTFDKLVKSVVLNSPGQPVVDIIPSNIKLSDIELVLNSSVNRERVLKRSFKRHRKEFAAYDVIIIDCPPSLSLLTLNAFVAADYLLVPVDASAYSHQGLMELVDSLGDANKIYNDFGTELIGIFFAKYAKNEKVYKESYDYLKSECGDRLFKTVINKNTAIERAPHVFKTIIEYAPKSKGCIDYRNLTAELMEKIDERRV
jgi:chromosome partitioning protein